MNNVTQALPTRQMAARDAAMMRWYPAMSLAFIHRLRLRRPGWPLIAGGHGSAPAAREAAAVYWHGQLLRRLAVRQGDAA